MHQHRPAALAALEIFDHAELAELAADLALLADDLHAGMIPAGARRARYPHEVAAGVNFADLTTAVDQRAANIARRLTEDRARFVDLLAADLEQTAATLGHLPPAEAISRRLDALLDPSQPTVPVAGSDVLVHHAEQFHLDELNAAARDGIDRAIAEARRQGLPAPGVPRLGSEVDGRIQTAARRLAAAPHADVIRAARDAAYQTPRAFTAATAVNQATTAATSLADGPLASTYARPAAQQAHNLGHQEGAGAMPAVAHIYASELLDSNTCGPCSLIDGHEYDSEEEALADYPDGTFVDCEGGDRCRGTLVYVFGDETAPSTPAPGDEAPPDEPPPPYPYGSTRPLPPAPPAAPAPSSLPAPEPLLPPPAATVPELPAEPPADVNPPLTPAGIPADLPEGVTAEQFTAARDAIPNIRADLRRLAAQAHDEAMAALEHVDARKLDRPPPRTVIHRDLVTGRREYRAEHSGEWDWFHGLGNGEQTRLRRNWFHTDIESHGGAPDEVAARWQHVFANAPESTDGVMGEWLDVTRRADASSALARGRLPNPDLYGGLDVNNLIETPYNARLVFGNDLDQAAAHIAARDNDLLASYAERAFRPARLGPAPYQMSAESFTSELTALEDEAARIAELPAGDGWETLDPADQEVLDRIAELVPDGVDDPDNPLPPDELHKIIMDLARRAGLT